MNEEKFKFNLNKIEKRFPNKLKLNAGEMLQCINISRATFSRIVEANDLHKIPKIDKKFEYKRSTSKYYKYQFDVYDICEFLSEE